jgi:hypothetical protein
VFFFFFEKLVKISSPVAASVSTVKDMLICAIISKKQVLQKQKDHMDIKFWVFIVDFYSGIVLIACLCSVDHVWKFSFLE